MKKADRAIGNWLVVCAILIGAMVLIGGLTRLTGSGLSITEWDLVMGTIPPLDESQWEIVFQKYQQSPEYKKVNAGMSLGDFKTIFWWEYVHRLLGRIMGLVFIIPLAYFMIRRQVTRPQAVKLMLLFILGGLQGLLGWYMVQSGLVNVPHVSHLRLTAHLTLAFLLFGATFWFALYFFDAVAGRKPPARPRPLLYNLALGIMGVIFLQIALGAMVAGLRAGYIFNTFPKMGLWWIPPRTWNLPLHNPTFVQFAHRITAYLVVILIAWIWWQSRRSGCSYRQRTAVRMLTLAGIGQVALGIATLLMVVPITLGSLHQLGALVLFGCSIHLCHSLRPR